MGRPWVCCVAVVVAVSALPGCLIVRQGAATRLDVASTGSDDVTQGFKSCAWTVRDGVLEVLAYGSHPREHETYAFIACEPSYAFMPRMIRLRGPATTDEATFEVVLLEAARPNSIVRWTGGSYPMWMYTGTAQLKVTRWFGERHIRLDNVTLQRVGHPQESATVSGRVVASDAKGKFATLQQDWGTLSQSPL